MNLLVSLHRGYGVGDAVQVGVVLRHLAAARPDLRIDFQAEEGRHQVARGIVANHFAYGQPYPADHYDAEVQVCLYERYLGWTDRPNTRVTACLHETFDLPWLPEYGRYRIDVRRESLDAARTLLFGLQAGRGQAGKPLRNCKFVAVHYQGDSAREWKDLTHDQAAGICRAVERLGYVPVVLDWRMRCPLPERRITIPQGWGGDAEMVAAVIRNCEAFVGIDSGPAKCASSTDVPSLVVWTKHHPCVYHDPAFNTTHLIPDAYRDIAPVSGDAVVNDWFEAHYAFREYGVGGLVGGVETWLEGNLR